MVKRRDLLRWLAGIPLSTSIWPIAGLNGAQPAEVPRRVRPGERGWPSPSDWARLKQEVDGNLTQPESPLNVCHQAPGDAECRALFRELKNPYFIGDSPF